MQSYARLKTQPNLLLYHQQSASERIGPAVPETTQNKLTDKQSKIVNKVIFGRYTVALLVKMSEIFIYLYIHKHLVKSVFLVLQTNTPILFICIDKIINFFVLCNSTNSERSAIIELKF